MILGYNAFISLKIIMFYTYIPTNSVPNYLWWYNNFVHCVKVCRVGTPFTSVQLSLFIKRETIPQREDVLYSDIRVNKRKSG